METLTLLTLGGVFVAVALVAGAATAAMFASAERRRLREVVHATPGSTAPRVAVLAGDPRLEFWQMPLNVLASIRGDLGQLQGRLFRAGFKHPAAPIIYTFFELVMPLVVGGFALYMLQGTRAYLAAAAGAAAMFFAPDLLLQRRLGGRRRQVLNGLPDMMDLLVVCVEAGSGLEQAIVRTGEELALAYPLLSEELRTFTVEMRAGKSRAQALKALSDRNNIDEVRAFVAILTQTDRFGTSVGQALRTHADITREKRRQRAEENAQKIGVKLVFPLVLCFFPALYVVLLGPAVIQFVRMFGKQ